MEQSQETENMQACINIQESSSLDGSMECTSSGRDDDNSSMEEEDEDEKGTIRSNLASSESTVRKSKSLLACNSISTLHLLQVAKRKIKKLKNANCNLRLENNCLKAKVNGESNHELSSSHSCSLVEIASPCIAYNELKDNYKELEKECIYEKEQNERLCLENSSLKSNCVMCKSYKLEIKEMDETFDEFRNNYQNHIDSIISTLKNSTIAYNKARHNLKVKNYELETKVNLLKEIIKKNSKHINQQFQANSKSKLNMNFHNMSKPNKGNKKYQMLENEIPNHYHLQHHLSPNINLKINKFPINNVLQNHHGNLTNKNNIKPRFEWRPKVKDETQTQIKRAHSIISPQKQTRYIWVPKGTATPGLLWIPKSLIH